MTTKSTNRADNLKLLNEWISLFFRMEIVYKNLRQMFDASPECEVNTVMNDIFSVYTKVIAEKISNKKDCLDWLNWFLYENDAGRKGFVAKASNWKKVRSIKNIENLLDLIENKTNNES